MMYITQRLLVQFKWGLSCSWFSEYPFKSTHSRGSLYGTRSQITQPVDCMNQVSVSKFDPANIHKMDRIEAWGTKIKLCCETIHDEDDLLLSLSVMSFTVQRSSLFFLGYGLARDMNGSTLISPSLEPSFVLLLNNDLKFFIIALSFKH
jgi:hypothetical protein